jgi:signal transduction histidine kinase
MRRRLQEIGGDCEVRSQPGAGTTITFRVMLKADPGHR